ncbi:hypothetical protein QYE76_026096 [Lolium multiflorum]|uniref:Uncharacterized protein n=1 Tax=Lolium multiflorum TaxID=4521 RepID=A0AAD8RJ16_LOLMU|nr:hypothetical protein QYE76_026096 [Lolium multiflorum]
MRATKDNLSADAIDKRIRVLIKIPRELHVFTYATKTFIRMVPEPRSRRLKKANSEFSSGFLPPATRIRMPHRRRKLLKPHALLRGRSQLLPAPMRNAPAKCLALRPRKAEAEKKRLSLINTSNKGQPAIQHFFKPSGQPPTNSVLQKLTLAQRHAEVSAMLNKVWGKPDEEVRELADLEDSLKEFFAKHKEVRQTTRKLHEDLRVHVLEQIAEIEGLRQHAEKISSCLRPAFKVRDPGLLLFVLTQLFRMHNMFNFLPSEETAKHSSFDELSAKVKVLEAENESLKAFIQESSSKETEARKELSEKHARDLAELNEKLEKPGPRDFRGVQEQGSGSGGGGH